MPLSGYNLYTVDMFKDGKATSISGVAELWNKEAEATKEEYRARAKREREKTKDVTRGKKELSRYNLFVSDHMAAHKSGEATARLSAAADEWNSLTDEQRETYVAGSYPLAPTSV